MANTTLISNFRDEEIESMYSHTVILENLDSDTVYHYEFGGETFMSSIYHFRAPKQRRAEYKLLLFSNLGFDDNSHMLIDQISKKIDQAPYLYDALIDLGSDRLLTNRPNDVIEYYERIAKLTSRVPYHGLNRANFMVKEYLGRDERENEMYYLQIDTAQIIFLDADAIFDDTKGEKIREVEKVTLANTLEDIRGWRFLLSDRPFYCSGGEDLCKRYSETMKSVYEKTIINNHFSMIISGGGSQYERTYPVTNSKFDLSLNSTQNRNIKKPIYITINGSIAKDSKEKNPWTAVSDGVPSFGILTINDDTEFQYKQYSVDGELIDEVSVISAVRLKYKILLWIVYGAIAAALLGFLTLLYNLEAFFPTRVNKFFNEDSPDYSDEGISTLHEEPLDLDDIHKDMGNKH